MKTLNLKSIFLLLFVAQSVFADAYIVMFKQTETTVGTLEHGAFQNLLQTANNKSVGELQKWLGSRGVRGDLTDLWLIRGAVANLDATTAAKLAKEPWVNGVFKNQMRKLVNPMSDIQVGASLADLGEDGANLWGLQKIGVPKIRAEFPEVTGAGVRVGILDTGIQSRHPELGDKSLVFRDFVNNLSNPYDDHGHGTHCAGTISGSVVGVAPKANLIFGKIFTAGGMGDDVTILRAMQWVFDPDGNPSTDDYPQVVSNSWGGDLPSVGPWSLFEFAPYQLAITTWIHGGISPIFAAGNSGKSPNGIPGGLPDALAVGAIDPESKVAKFSSRGPNLWRIGESVLTVLKPDVSAPGVKITSAFPGNKYATWAGTSMATPHVAGAVALALQVNKKLKYADIKELLLKTSEKKMDVSYGFGVMNAYELVKAALKR